VTATLTFTLPEEQDEHDCALHGVEWRATASDMAEWLKRKRDGNLSEEEDSAYAEARQYLFSILEQRGLALW
jgi:hypothetical protein